MPFENDRVRIGPTGARKELFKMPGRNGKLRYGKKFELPEYLAQLGLSAYEFPGGRLATFSNSPIYEKFCENAQKYDIAISFHAPYYISLTSANQETYERSIERVANSYAWAVWMNAKRIVVHPGSYTKDKSKSELHQMIVNGIIQGIERANEKYPEYKNHFKEICLCPETMGKLGQLGPTEEVIAICKDIGLEKTRPCVDFGHVYARMRGSLTGKKLYESNFNLIESELGKTIVENLHIHYSRIAYTDRGEKKHVPNSDTDWGPEITPLFELIHENGYHPIIINESPELEPDAVRLVQEWSKKYD